AGADPRPAGTERRRLRLDATSLVTLLTVGGAVLFVFWQMKPGLLFANTTTSGGDTGAHVWGPAYLRDHLLPSGRLTGWSPDWYAGFPWLTFYFPLPSLLVVLVNLILPYNVAFKLVTVLGLVTLPVAAWGFGRLARMRPPGPACLAVATLPFLFDRSFTIYGGNIPSTLAGEFSFSISLSLALVFLGVLARGLDTGRHRALAAGLLALTGLCHIVPVLFALAGAAVLTILRLDPKRLRYTLSVGAVAGLLGGFWVVPFLFRMPYTNDMGWEKLTDYGKQLFPSDLRWLLVLGVVGAVSSVRDRARTGTFLTAMAALSAAVFVLAPQGRLWNARLLPMWFFCLYLLAGVAVTKLGMAAAASLNDDPERGRRAGLLATPVAALAAALAFVAMPLHILPAWAQVDTADRSFIPTWVEWNYSGYENKPSYDEYKGVVDTMAQVGQDEGCGRAFWEYEPQLDRYGTPMALMLLPYWTDGCIGSMEGLFFESAATTPYHFLIQSELSAKPSRPQRDLPYGELDVARGVEHLKLLGVRYYMALSPEAQAQAQGRPDLRLVATTPASTVTYPDGAKERHWEVYEVAGSELVEPLQNEPVVVTGVPKGGPEWLSMATRWYQDPGAWSVPWAASGPGEWRRVRQPPDAGDAPRPVPPARVTDIRAGDDSISFDVDRPGSPVLVKASYFPNWKPSGARGPWRVTPNLMVVVPTEGHVELNYGYTPVDALGWGMTLLGLGGLAVLAGRRPWAFRFRRREAREAREAPGAKDEEQTAPAGGDSEPAPASVPAEVPARPG
ncbi:MAG: 6-pyruvoyl-tetrahydropterin synthase-related protein, partial [Actinomycetota bacterium]|nr:6-pyruvoyl-tetrahydropterin synthase-related protein [Actinomycetota bacterium]